jgi:hypothetical protein
MRKLTTPLIITAYLLALLVALSIPLLSCSDDAGQSPRLEADRRPSGPPQQAEELIQRSKSSSQKQEYDAALSQIESALAIEPHNPEAVSQKQMVEDMIYLRGLLDSSAPGSRQKDGFLKTDEAGIPIDKEVHYPRNWKELNSGARPDGDPGSGIVSRERTSGGRIAIHDWPTKFRPQEFTNIPVIMVPGSEAEAPSTDAFHVMADEIWVIQV